MCTVRGTVYYVGFPACALSLNLQKCNDSRNLILVATSIVSSFLTFKNIKARTHTHTQTNTHTHSVDKE